MNIRTSYVLIAVLAMVGTLSISSAYAALPPACPACEGNDPVESARIAAIGSVPVTIMTDRITYDHESTIRVDGTVANIRSATPITLIVYSPINNVVSIDQLMVDSNGRFSTTLSTQGNLWKYDGTYTIRVQYGNQAVSNKALVELTGGILPSFETRPTVDCRSSELSIAGVACVPFSISGGTVTGARPNTGDNSIVISISSTEPGTLTVNPSSDVLGGIFMILVDGEEWDDVEIDGNQVTVEFPAGTEEIEIIGTFVIPEFGAIAALILAVAIISIIVVSAKTRLSLIPRY